MIADNKLVRFFEPSLFRLKILIEFGFAVKKTDLDKIEGV
jgi:hypothetical protein